jgi:hypothetical protein
MLSGSIEWEHRPDEGLILRFKPPLGKIMPDETRGHVRAARKEMLLALRSLVDAAIVREEEANKKAGKRRTKIEVE